GDYVSSLEAINGGHTCALSASGAAYCWGVGGNGQLGDGTSTSRSVPTLVSGGLTFTALFAGARSTCALTADGTAYCWGTNSSGEIGDGTTTTRPSPVAVAGGLKFKNLAIRSGVSSHTCGVTIGGAAYCWGDSGTSGALGDGTTTPRLTPTAVTGGLNFSSVVAGGTIFGSARSCGLTTGAAAYCWGTNSTSGLGNGTTGSSAVPVPVSGGLTFISLAAYWGHTCGLTAARAVYCWGQNDSGQLGDGTQVARLVPTAVIGVP
ncbi:MAG: RCC1 repeat-containing protein, partial [Gemmatimonas sp.]